MEVIDGKEQIVNIVRGLRSNARKNIASADLVVLS